MSKKRFMKKCILIMTASLFCLSIACSGKEALKIGTGDSTGNYYAFGNKIGEVLKGEGFSPKIKETAGSAANIRLLQDGYLDMAFAQSDTITDGINGTGSFQGQEKKDKIRALTGIYDEQCHIVVSQKSGIESIEELEGKTISLGETDSGVLEMAKKILLSYGLTQSMLTEKNLSFKDSAAAMEKGEIDGFFCTALAPVDTVSGLAGKIPIRILSIDKEHLEKILSRYKEYTKITIPKGTYKGQEEDVSTIGVRAFLLVREDCDKQVAQRILKGIFQNRDKLQDKTGSVGILEFNEAFKDMGVPYAEAALEFAQSKGE